MERTSPLTTRKKKTTTRAEAPAERADPAALIARVAAAIERHGLLLLTDRELPSVTGEVVGGPVAGSWWSHPRGHDIYAVCCGLEARDDVEAAKLVAGKVTYVHRRLWPALLGVAGERAPWQLEGLSAAAIAALAELDLRGEVAPAPPAPARELEARLLARSWQVHTESGHHAKVLASWAPWAEARQVTPLAPAAARAALEEAALALGPTARLPWQQARRRRAPRAR